MEESHRPDAHRQSEGSERFRLSISWRLTIWYGLTVLILLSLLALFSYTTFHFRRHVVFDEHLSHETRELTPFLRLDGEEPRFASLDRLRSVAFETHGLHSTYVRLFSRDGEALYQSPNFVARGSLPVEIPKNPETTTVSRTWDDNAARTTYTPLFTHEDRRLVGWLEVTGFEWSLNEQLSSLGRGLILGIAFSVLLAIFAGYALAQRALRPVVTLTAAANQIRASDLGSRLPVRSGVRDELTDLAETFNAMLDRIEDSFERERRFSDNAAHELLTPLSNLGNATEVALRRSRSPESYRETLSQQLVDIEELTHIVRGLLQLSRAEQIKNLPTESVDLAVLGAEHVDRFRQRAHAKELELNFRADSGTQVPGSPQQLGELLDNLLDNAIKYTPQGGRIDIEISNDGSEANIRVADSGIGFSETRPDDLFDRFYRGTSTKVQTESGSGLGLAIVKTIAQAFGGRVSARSDGADSGSTFEVWLPLEERPG